MFLHLFHKREVVSDRYDPKPAVPQLRADLRVRALLPKSIVMRSIHEDANTWEVFPLVVEVWLDMHSGGRAVLGIVRQLYTAVAEEAEELPFERRIRVYETLQPLVMFIRVSFLYWNSSRRCEQAEILREESTVNMMVVQLV